MSMGSTQLSSSFATGGGGSHYEAHVQASFVTLMLTGGYVPFLPCWPIKEIKLQGRIDGYNTDDMIAFVENPQSGERRKILCQIKSSIKFTKSDNTLKEVLQAAWNDFIDRDLFTQDKDRLALITGPLNRTDSKSVLWFLERAKHTRDYHDFLRHVTATNFSPRNTKEKLDTFRSHLNEANGDSAISDEQFYSFLRHYCVLGYDLGKEAGVVLSLIHSHMSQFQIPIPEDKWARIVDIVHAWNQNAGTITIDDLPLDLIESFRPKVVERIPEEIIVVPSEPIVSSLEIDQAKSLSFVNLLGSWQEKNDADIEVIKRLIDEI